LHSSPFVTGRCSMCRAQTRVRARVGLWISRAKSLVLILLAILVAAHAGSAGAAQGPFIPIDLGTLGQTERSAQAINTGGQVVGSSLSEPVTTQQFFRAFLGTAASGMVDLGTLGGADARAFAVNDSGQVVGSSLTASNASPTPDHAFSWTAASGMVD